MTLVAPVSDKFLKHLEFCNKSSQILHANEFASVDNELGIIVF